MAITKAGSDCSKYLLQCYFSHYIVKPARLRELTAAAHHLHLSIAEPSTLLDRNTQARRLGQQIDRFKVILIYVRA